jgi:hypothetical protein
LTSSAPGTNRTVVHHRQASFRVRRRWLRVPVLPPEAGSRKCPHIAFLRSAVISTFQACQKSSSALTTMRLSIKRCNLRTVSISRFGTISVGLRGFRVARQRYRPPQLAASFFSLCSARRSHCSAILNARVRRGPHGESTAIFRAAPVVFRIRHALPQLRPDGGPKTPPHPYLDRTDGGL